MHAVPNHNLPERIHGRRRHDLQITSEIVTSLPPVPLWAYHRSANLENPVARTEQPFLDPGRLPRSISVVVREAEGGIDFGPTWPMSVTDLGMVLEPMRWVQSCDTYRAELI
jgi:hypothetical protein